MIAVQRLRDALRACRVDESFVARIFESYEDISDRAAQEKRAAFFVQAVERMDQLLDECLCRDVRDACACSKGGWRLKSMQKIARECRGESVQRTLAAVGRVAHMGNPVLNADGTIAAGIGSQGGFPCPCPVFDGLAPQPAVSKTYCYCCAGHFRHHYQVALGRPLRTRAVLSSALHSQGKAPCRFVFEIVDETMDPTAARPLPEWRCETRESDCS